MTADLLCLHERFERQVAATPDRVALTYAGEHLSYRALNERANQLAAYLREQGVGHETRVGLCLDRSFDTVVAILAVLKAGGAYVPMDPVYPAGRVQMIVEDAECPLVLVHAAHADRFEMGAGTKVIVLDGAERPWEACATENLPSITTPESLAYVIYTSGSTGRPKGALVTHRNVYRLFPSMQPDFGFNEHDVWTMFHSYAFDFSVSEMWGAFFYGGRLVVVPYLVSRTPTEFYQLLIDERVTVLNQTPSAFKQIQLLDEAAPPENSRKLKLRYALIGGEFMALPGLASWYERHHEASPRLVHVYGITETTVFVTYRHLGEADTAPGTPSLIGKTIADLTTYVLDEDRKPVAVGEVGELYVGGPGVCNGYLKRPDLTAERFIQDPVGNAGTLYKSGDLVRLLDGDLEFIGRNDAQVQLRGHRVELGEIETALELHPEVKSAIVRMREDTPGDQRLVAYYLAPGPVDTADVRAHLGKSLPLYMLPSAFVYMTAFPLNNNGKVDTSALPAPAALQADRIDFVAPQTPTEEALADIWQEVLGASRVGTADDFFALGGHSLLATQMLVRVRSRFGVELSLRTVMETPALSACAAAIDALAQSGGRPAASADIALADRSVSIPLSFAQEQVWIIEELQPGNTAYQIPLVFEVEGAVDPDRMKQAIYAIARRHEILRTVFVNSPEGASQVVRDVVDIPFAIIQIPDTDSRQHVWESVSAASREPMPLSSGPLTRVMLFQQQAGRGYLGIVIHHAIFDGWSISVFLEELATFYESPDAALAPLPVQYADYAAWQRAQIDTPKFKQQLDYWKRQLGGELPVLNLPLDFPRPPRPTWDGAVVQSYADESLTAALNELARSQNKTLFMTLMAAWYVLLHRYSRQDELIVGTAMAGRSHEALERLIGFFVNTVAIRVTVDRDQPFPEFLNQIERVTVEAQEHQDVPFERVVAELPQERDPSRAPVFQAMFVLHNMPEFEKHFDGLGLAGEEISNGASKFDVTLAAQLRGKRLQFSLEYNTALFRETTAMRLLRSYTALLESMVENPEAGVGEFRYLDEEDGSRVMSLAGDRSALDASQSLCRIVSAHAARTPEAPAALDASETLSYAELDRRSNQLAQLLIARGVGFEEPVPFYLGRSVRVLIAMLGILKAGAAYVPLDLQDPPARRKRILDLLSPRLLLSESGLAGELADLKVETLEIDRPESFAAQDTSAPDVPVSGEQLAYIIFTSGSTGEPKGVCCNHLGVINLYEDLQQRQPTGTGDVCSVWAAFSFDATVYEVWTGLLSGAAVCIAPEEVRLVPEDFLSWTHTRGVTAAYLPGYMLPALLTRQQNDPLPLRRLMAGVEPLPEALLSDIVSATPGLMFVNAYGPTEATVYATLYLVRPGPDSPAGNAPIGTPIRNTRVYVLDGRGELVPPGVAGELHVAGAGLARGYFSDENLTAAQFIRNPFDSREFSLLYRTGDEVYLRDDGNLQYLRRMGRYIKLRGFRIEPGEIESVLRRVPGVAEAVVEKVTDAGDGSERLVAYCEANRGKLLGENQLRDKVSEELPAHMRPAQYLILEKLPRTVQGKLDRAALPIPAASEAVGTMAAPSNEIEERIAAIWEAILKVPQVDVQGNFFDLGGHSLLAIQVVARINEEFGASLTALSFFEAPTVKALAERIGAGDKGAAGAVLSTGGKLLQIKPGSRTPFFCLKGAGEVGGSYDSFARAFAEDQPFFGFPDLDFPEFQARSTAPTVEELATRCIVDIRRTCPHGPYYVGGYSFGGVVAFEIARQLLASGEEVPLVAMLDSGTPGCYETIRGVPFAHVRNTINKYRVRFTMFACTWKMQLGYLRDGLGMGLRRLIARSEKDEVFLGWREYLRWVRFDTSVQYFLIQAGLVKAAIRDHRLALVHEHLVRHSTRSMVSSSRSMDAYAFEPIPAEITLFRAEHNPWRTERFDPSLGWGCYAQKGVRIEVVPGNHMVIIRRPFATDLGRAVQRVIDDIEREPGSG